MRRSLTTSPYSRAQLERKPKGSLAYSCTLSPRRWPLGPGGTPSAPASSVPSWVLLCRSIVGAVLAVGSCPSIPLEHEVAVAAAGSAGGSLDQNSRGRKARRRRPSDRGLGP